jgi:hypothetical protein
VDAALYADRASDVPVPQPTPQVQALRISSSRTTLLAFTPIDYRLDVAALHLIVGHRYEINVWL